MNRKDEDRNDDVFATKVAPEGRIAYLEERLKLVKDERDNMRRKIAQKEEKEHDIDRFLEKMHTIRWKRDAADTVFFQVGMSAHALHTSPDEGTVRAYMADSLARSLAHEIARTRVFTDPRNIYTLPEAKWFSEDTERIEAY